MKTEIAARNAAGQPVRSVVTDDRDLDAALAYYGRDISVPLLSWRKTGKARHYFESDFPFTPASPSPALLVALRPAPAIEAAFGSVTPLGTGRIPAGRAERTLHMSMLANLRGR